MNFLTISVNMNLKIFMENTGLSILFYINFKSPNRYFNSKNSKAERKGPRIEYKTK